MSNTEVIEVRPPARPRPSRARWGHHPTIALFVIVTCQLMVVLDATVVNIALPNIQSSLHFSATNLAWVLNAYTLTFGGLLLLGGRAGDILGRRRIFAAGLALFTLASLVGGLANSAGWLLAARAAQGVGGALASPTALALITTNFDEGAQRTRAFGIYAAVSAAGSGLGLIIGGMLTDWVSWRWVLFINVPIGLAAIALTPLFIHESQRHPGRFDVAGALTSTAGMGLVVYGFIRAAGSGWSDELTIGALVLGVALLLAFLAIELRADQPITPLRLIAHRNRASAYGIRLLLVAGMFGMFFFLTQFVQDVLGYSPLRAGFAFLPLTAALFVSARAVTRLLPRFGPKWLTAAGIAVATGGMAWLSQISVGSGYVTGVLGPMLLFGVGMGFPFVALTLLALSGVRPADSGAASGLVNVSQQVGASVGLAVLVTIFGTASRHAASRPLAGASRAVEAHHVLTSGIASAFTAGAILLGCALVVAVLAVNARRAQTPA